MMKNKIIIILIAFCINNNSNLLNKNSINSNNNLLNNNIYSSSLFLDELNNIFKKNISQSALDLVKCFIYFSQSNDPLACQKCNNFDCKKYLGKYFEGKRENIPLCEKAIKLNKLKENIIVKDIEEILNEDCDKKKIEELPKLIEEKKRFWGNETSDIINLIK